ncbi:MAG: LysR family transcriptional regulator [Acidimicrobiales bacterium]
MRYLASALPIAVIRSRALSPGARAVDIKHLQALIGIADTGSFSAAADRLGTVQSNVSAHVARLERELGGALVDRSAGRLTEEGEVVVARARRIMAEMDAMVSDVFAMRREIRGSVRVGMIGTTGRWLVPVLFAELRERHPEVRMAVADGTSTTLEPGLLAGQLDLAVVTMPVQGEELSASPLFEEDLVLVVPADDPLVGTTQPVPLEQLAELELLLPMPGTALRDEIDATVRPAGVTLHPSMELDGLRLIASLTFDGYGPAILPATAVSRHLRREFRLLPLAGFPRRRVGVALRSRGLPSAPTRALIDLLYAVVQNDEERPEGVHPALAARTRHR